MSEQALTLIFMGVVLKIPLVGLAWIVWWALRSQPQVEGLDSEGGDGGSKVHRPTPRFPRFPRGPRRGPGSVPPRPVPSRPHGGRPRPTAPRPAPARRH